MSLDTHQKQGSAIALTLPWRVWISDPNDALSLVGSQLSLLKMCSDFEASAGLSGPWFQRSGQVHAVGLVAGATWSPGNVAGQVYAVGNASSEVAT